MSVMSDPERECLLKSCSATRCRDGRAGEGRGFRNESESRTALSRSPISRIVLGGGGGRQGAPKKTAGAPGARPSRPGVASRYSPRPSRMALAGARSSAGRLSEWTMPPHPLPARLRAAERAHGVVDGKIALAHLLGYVHSRIVSVVYGVANKRFSTRTQH